MIRPGDIYIADIAEAFPHPVVIVSREELNRGDYVLAAVVTSSKGFERRYLSRIL